MTSAATKPRKSVREKIVLTLIVVCGALLFNNIGHSSTQRPGVASLQERLTLAPFFLTDLQGKTWSLEAHRGKVVLLNFWATWCPPCVEETPGLVHLAKEYAPQGLAVAGVNMDGGGDVTPVTRFVAEYHLPYPVLIPDANASLPRNVEGLPTTLLLDRQGRIAKTYVGAVDEATFKADVVRLLVEDVTAPGEGADHGKGVAKCVR